MVRTRARCPVCQRGPYQLGNLYDHLRFVHWWSKEKVDQLKMKIKNTKFEGREGLECECGKIYYSQHGLRVHRERMHGVPLGRSATYYPVICPACHDVFRTGEELALHCDEKHREQGGQDFSMIQGTFPTHEEFEEWIDSVERLTKVEFTKRTSRVCKDGRNHIFVCKHARGKGAAVDPKEIKQRFKKTERVHSHCPAFIRVIENSDGSISYRGCLGHLGHKVGVTKTQRNPRQRFRRWQTHRRHKDALLYYTYRVESCITELSEDTWAVQSEDGFEYTVNVGEPCSCDENNTHCDRCGACPYQIRCNCSDVAHKGVSCVHAHVVATFIDKARELIPSVQHYLATEMPGCTSTPGPSSENDQEEPPLLDTSADMYNPDGDEHYEEYLLTEGKQSEEQSGANTPPPLIEPQIEPQTPQPKVIVELLRPPKVGANKLRLSPPVVTLREEAKEELEQFHGLDEKLHMMLNTCMQSNLPHVIRDIRSTIESKLSEFLPVNGEKPHKTRLQRPLEHMKQDEVEPSSSTEQEASPSQYQSQSNENKTPATRKVLRREFLEARSSRIRLSDEDQIEVLRVRTEREQNRQVQRIAPEPTRKILKREFIEASTSRYGSLAEELPEESQSSQQQENNYDKQVPPGLRHAKVLSREYIQRKPPLGPLLRRKSDLGPLPHGYRRVVRQTVITQGGRRVVKRVVVRRPMLPSEKALVVALEQSAVEKQQEAGEGNKIERLVEGTEMKEILEHEPQKFYKNDVAEENQEIVRDLTESSTLAAEDHAQASVSAEERVESDPEIHFLKEQRSVKKLHQATEQVAKPSEDGHASPSEFHRTESETSRDGARVVKKIYARRGSEWVLKRLVIRPTDDHSHDSPINVEALSDGKECNASQKEETIAEGVLPVRNSPSKVIRRVVVRKGANAATINDEAEQVHEVGPLQDAEHTNLFHRTPALIRKGLTTALTPKTDSLQPRTEVLCLMCGKAEPPYHVTEEKIFWMGCSNGKKCHVRAHEKCLRAARARCFVCHAGTWVRVLVKSPNKSRLGLSARSASKAGNNFKCITRDANGCADTDKTPQSPTKTPSEERTPALCEINS